MADDGSWTIEDGEVVCHQLGFEIPSEHDVITIKYTCARYNILMLVLMLFIPSAHFATLLFVIAQIIACSSYCLCTHCYPCILELFNVTLVSYIVMSKIAVLMHVCI